MLSVLYIMSNLFLYLTPFRLWVTPGRMGAYVAIKIVTQKGNVFGRFKITEYILGSTNWYFFNSGFQRLK